MHFNARELTLIYNGENSDHKKTLAYAQSLAKKINKQEINSVRVSDTLFHMAFESLGVNGKSVINKADPVYQRDYRGKDLTPSEWLAMLKQHPHLLQSPIAIYGNQVVICQTPTHVLKVLNRVSA